MAEIITTVEAGRRLGVTPQRIRQYIAEGRIRAQKVGRDYLVDAESVDEFRPRPTGNPNFGPGFRPPPAKE
jgi:excisionase family DNA binding protein